MTLKLLLTYKIKKCVINTRKEIKDEKRIKY